MNFDTTAQLLAILFIGAGFIIFAIGLIGDHDIRKTYPQ